MQRKDKLLPTSWLMAQLGQFYIPNYQTRRGVGVCGEVGSTRVKQIGHPRGEGGTRYTVEVSPVMEVRKMFLFPPQRDSA